MEREAESAGSINCHDWVLKLCSLDKHGLVSGLSNGKIDVIPFGQTEKHKEINAHGGAVNNVRKVDENSFCSCSNDGIVKIWDLRSPDGNNCVAAMEGVKKLPFVSLDARDTLVGAGTELKGDSHLFIWDRRRLSVPFKQFTECHQDDITEVRFHPTRHNMLLSGSTDGYVNVYDLKAEKEEDALLQVINFASVHSANFLPNDKLYTLSHMETFSVHSLIDTTTEESVESDPVDYGDIRDKWNCEYVVDLYAPGYICCGSNSTKQLRLYQFDPEKVAFDGLSATSDYISLPGAHGDDIVRDMVIHNGVIYTGGEDGLVKIWNVSGNMLGDTSSRFFGQEASSKSHHHHHKHAQKKLIKAIDAEDGHIPRSKRHKRQDGSAKPRHHHHNHHHHHSHKSSRFMPYSRE